MSMPSLAALRAFDAAARSGSFKVAAEALNVSATAISHHVRGLEAQIGVTLFVRGTRQVSLTDAGRELAEATSVSFSRIQATIDALQTSETVATISTTPAFAALWFAPRVATFEARHPNVRVRMVSSTEVTDLRRDQSIDIALRYGAEDEESDDVALVTHERFQAFGTKDYIERLNDISDAQFISTRWISKTLKPVTWQNWFEAAGDHMADKAKIREFDQEYEVLQAGLSGQGLILISDVLAQDMVSRGWLVHYRPVVHLPGFAYTVHVSPKKKELRKVQFLCSWLLEEMNGAADRP
ncbi:MAG TPA: LysR family transcriptional regulator [Rhodospirillaceae bacterium]|nr:LysR family transcriptional regulator [Rhodospirillaceae bacterium]